MKTESAWLREFFSWSPEALEALDGKRNWEAVPNTDDPAAPISYYQTDDGLWSWYKSYIGYEVEDRIPFITEYNLFECGDFEFYDRTALDVPITEWEIFARMYSESKKTHAEYLEWVLETGKDPMRYFILSRVSCVKEKWQYRLFRSIVGTILKDARKNSRGRWLAPDELPDYVKHHFMLDKIGGRWIVFGEMEREKRPKYEEVFTKGQRRIFKYDGGVWYKDITEVEYDKPINPKILKRKLKKRAYLALQELKKETVDEKDR